MASTTATIPTFTDSATGSNSGNGSGSDNTGSLVNYYFVFLALIIAIAGLSGFLVYRRRKRAMAAMRYSREHALARDVSGWNGRSRGYWPGRGRQQEDEGPEEGLNELGEAPPAYVPRKSREETTAGPTIPLQTLSREDAGLKPPDYSHISEPAVSDAPYTAAAGSSRVGPHERDVETGALRT